jgi:hypothetical protein
MDDGTEKFHGDDQDECHQHGRYDRADGTKNGGHFEFLNEPAVVPRERGRR